MEAIKNMLSRRSIRRFKDREIERETLDTILSCAIHSPTGMNLQNRQFTVITKADEIERLRSAMEIGLKRANYSFYNPKVLILITVPRDSINGESDCSTAIQNIYLACNALGLGSVWINQLRLCQDDLSVRAILDSWGIPSNHVNFGFSAIGYPDEVPKEKERTELIKYI